MSKIFQIVAPDVDPVEQRAFFDATKSKACTHLAIKLATQRAALVKATGATGILAEHVARGIDGEVALCESLTAEAAALSTALSEAQAGNAAYGQFVKDANHRFSQYVWQASRINLDVGCVEIPELEAKIRDYERTRAGHRERLLEAGLDNDQIDGAGLLKPDAEELAVWHRDLEAKRDRVARAKAFIASAPLFDLSLLDGDLSSKS
ncbi:MULTISPECIES: hypothetical protein [Paraburkholderia]|uniref:Uncharacterized protein n=1 Tax=Paraburkholderia podalyriae TaxID=1938811 RepID=A0ABR7PQI8_9BURK|nr:hypothetical protein [Paraburkholderia podalyriae]MBC8748524.1 hypothetical protein [Paraburkholderia podalyriae]